MLGTVGHLALLVAFVACALSTFAFFWATFRAETAPRWLPVGRAAWGVMAAGVITASAVLWYALLTHQYQFAYVYQQSSNDLPLQYLVSSFWGGQEGSFLLWGLMMCLTGGTLIAFVKRSYESAVMTTVALSQLFLLSMIVGLQIGPLAIGASPFDTLAQAFPEAPIFQQNPDFVPVDGKGLNDLLQNPWMAIHPPMLFAGFSSMVVPFAFAVAALWTRQYTQWVRPALPWTLAAVATLGVGIAMGGYWAYVTLSFGGYWAWDPVENSSLVPWMVGVAAFHTMLVQKKSGSSHKAALLLSILAYLLVIYSTFLTRSGILGDISVHSFVDLGLYGQLVIWIVGLGAVGLGLFAWRYRDLPVPEREPRTLSREFMIFSGAMLFTAAAAVIILGTSAPIFGRLFREAPSAVPLSFYNEWTLPLALGFTFLIGLGQLFWWHKMSVENVNRALLKPIALATACTIAVLVLTPFAQQTITLPAEAAQGAARTAEAGFASGLAEFWDIYGMALQMLLLTFAGFFALFGNGMVLWRVGRGNARMAGGAVAHVGFALLILGVVASSGFSSPLPQVGQPRVADAPQSRDNFVLARGQTRTINGYTVTYTGKTLNERGRGRYHLDVTDPRGRAFSMDPVAYEGTDGQWFMHPDVKAFVEKDIFTAVIPRAATGVDDQNGGRPGGELEMAQGDSTVVGDQAYAVAFRGFDLRPDRDLVPADAEITVAARVDVTHLPTGETRTMQPIYIVMPDGSQQYVETRARDWDLGLAFTSMNVDTGKATLAFDGVEVMPEDWVVVQAYEKPFISLVWIGIIVMTVGFGFATARRAQDAR
jgi:cytochrome c-type biogenesis protein CcmF